MDRRINSENTVYNESRSNSGPLSLVSKSEDFVETDEIVDILKKTAASLHSLNSSSTFSMVHSSNSPGTQEEVDRILSSHFYPLNLTNTQSVVAFLLLTCFVLKKQTREAESLKKLYEDHISLLKDKNSELEDKLLRNSAVGDTGGKMSPDCSSMSPMTTTGSQECTSCEHLKARVVELTQQVAQLKSSYDEVCHVNGQWAQDYETLSKQIRNATGFHSVPDSLPSSAGSTSMHVSPPPQGVIDPAHCGHSHSSCVRCSIYKSQLEDSAQEAEDLRAQVVGLREDIKDCKERLSQKHQEMRCLENEYQILRIQVQEIGDLQLALNMKQEYRKMQRTLQQKTKLYQDAMCEKLDLQKQVEKLRQAFLKCFPIPAPLQAAPAASSSTLTSRPPPSGSYYSFPLHSCRNNLQSSSGDGNPPTPPGLLARGDMKGAIVEKDDQMVPRIKLDQDPPTPRINRHNSGMQSRSLEHLDIMHDTAPRGRGFPEDKVPQGNTSLSLSPGALRLSDLALNNGFDGTYRRGESLASGEFVTRSRSSNYASHSSASSTTSTDMAVNRGNMGVPGSHSGSMSHSNTALLYNTPSSLSSLGYGSNDSSSLDSHSLNHTHRHAPYASRMRGNGQSEMEVVRRDLPEYQSNKSQLGRSASFTTRPSSLSLNKGATTSGNLGGKAQFFYCPNCKKSFSCVGKDSFDSWFEHVKSCNA